MKKFEDILAKCVDDIDSGMSTIDDCLDRYPYMRKRLEPLLRIAAAIPETPHTEPSLAFKTSAPARLMDQIRDKQSATTWHWLHSETQAKPMPQGRRRFRMATAALTVVLTLCLLSGGTATAAQFSLPGDTLYPMKLHTEQVRLMLPGDDVAKAELALDFAARRVAEIEALAERGRLQDLDLAVQGYDQAVSTIAARIAQADDKGLSVEGISGLVAEATSTHYVVLEMVYDAVPAEGKEPIMKALEISLTGRLRALEALAIEIGEPIVVEHPESGLEGLILIWPPELRIEVWPPQLDIAGPILVWPPGLEVELIPWPGDPYVIGELVPWPGKLIRWPGDTYEIKIGDPIRFRPTEDVEVDVEIGDPIIVWPPPDHDAAHAGVTVMAEGENVEIVPGALVCSLPAIEGQVPRVSSEKPMVVFCQSTAAEATTVTLLGEERAVRLENVGGVQPLPATDVEIGEVIFYEFTEKEFEDIQQQAYEAFISTLGRGRATGKAGESLLGETHAVVIGTDCIGNLQGASENSARSMYQALTDVYGYEAENVALLLGKKATFEAVYTAIHSVKATAKPSDEVVFYFSGHGTKGKASDGNVMQGIYCYDHVIWDRQLKQWFEGFPTCRIVFIFDCCYAGGMTELAEDGRIVVMATEEHRMAIARASLPRGRWYHLFSLHFVVNGIHAALADVYDHDGNGRYTYTDWLGRKHIGDAWDVAIEEAFDYAKEVILNDPLWLFYRQRPTIIDGFDDDLILRRRPRLRIDREFVVRTTDDGLLTHCHG